MGGASWQAKTSVAKWILYRIIIDVGKPGTRRRGLWGKTECVAEMTKKIKNGEKK